MIKKILIVDDSKFQRNQVLKTLVAASFEVDQASNGKEALTKIQAQSYDLLISDLLMPELDGIGLLKQLQALQIKTPVIVVTADIQEPVKQECLTLGAKAFLNKPFDGEALLNSIKNLKI
jgi:twitching motility two-component system response regulator PilH